MPCAAQWVTQSTCLNDQLEVKVQRIVTARPMSLIGQSVVLDGGREVCRFTVPALSPLLDYFGPDTTPATARYGVIDNRSEKPQHCQCGERLAQLAPHPGVGKRR